MLKRRSRDRPRALYVLEPMSLLKSTEPKGISARIVLVQWSDAIAVRPRLNVTGSDAQIYAAAGEQSHTAASKILCRGQEIGGQFVLHGQSPRLRI